MFKRLKQTIYIFIICSLFLHTLTWVSFDLAPPTSFLHHKVPVEIEIRSADDDIKHLKPKDQAQIVEQEKAVNDELDEDAKYLSAFNQKVKKQTRADHSGAFQNAQQLAGQKAPQQSTPKPETTPEETPSKRDKNLPSLSSLKPQLQMLPKEVTLPGEEGSSAQASATDDYLKDVEVGLQTMLSTREFVYYSYYSRIKDRIRQHWEPNIREKVKMIFRQGRTIASAKDHVTQVVITLNKEGELMKVEVVTASGMQALDDAAVEAFRSAQPFPNPPKGLIDEDGTIKIRWDFVLEASSYQPHSRVPRVARGD